MVQILLAYGDYTVYVADTVNSIGNPKTGTLDISSSVTNVNDGWNLVGNPYAAHLSWDALFSSASQVGSTIMIFDEVLGDYETFSTGSGVEIAPHQGFWIQSTGTASFAFTEAVKTTTNTSLFKNSKHDLFSLTVRKNNSSVNLSSTTKFNFNSEASIRYTRSEDVSFKKVPHHLAPVLASYSTDGTLLRINSFSPGNNINIPLQFICAEEGDHTISLNNIDFASIQGYNCIRLVDRKTGTETDLLNVNEYVFTALKTDDAGRFVLKLSKENDCPENSPENQVVFGNTTGGVNVIFDTEIVYPATVSITNLIGQAVAEIKQTSSVGTYHLSTANLVAGIYLVNVSVNDKSYTHKLVVQ